jgi:hypothetical protein
MTAMDHPASAHDAHDREQIERHGIVVVRADHYRVDGYQYTSLADALAQARRRAASSGRSG